MSWALHLQSESPVSGLEFIKYSPVVSIDKLAEETAELQEAIRRDEGMAEEVGDALFALAKVANALGVEAEQALREASDRFVARFAAMAEAAGRTGRSLPQMDIEEMLRFWEKTG